MLVYCKKSFLYLPFYNGQYYNISVDYQTVFEYHDFITIKFNEPDSISFRFRLNQSTQFAEGYIGENELYFYDYFSDVKAQRKSKLEQLSNI